jgi:hypothetical protein
MSTDSFAKSITSFSASVADFGRFILNGGQPAGKPIEVTESYRKDVASRVKDLDTNNEAQVNPWVEKHGNASMVRGSGSADTVHAVLTPGEEVLQKSDPRHRDNYYRTIDSFKEMGARVTSDFRGDNMKSAHGTYDAFDVGLGKESASMSPSAFEGYKKSIEARAAREGYSVRYEGKGQYNPGTGSYSSGMHAHLQRINGREMPSLAPSHVPESPAMMAGMAGSPGDSAQQTLKLDPSVASSLSSAAGSNDASADKLSQVASSLMQVAQMLASNIRSGGGRGGNSLVSSVARGAAAFG